MTSNEYINAAIKWVEETAQKPNRRINGCRDTLLPSNYRPETDTSDELGTEMMREYQEFIGILRWAVELGHIDILVVPCGGIDVILTSCVPQSWAL